MLVWIRKGGDETGSAAHLAGESLRLASQSMHVQCGAHDFAGECQARRRRSRERAAAPGILVSNRQWRAVERLARH
ncbi:hypothetical protein AB0H57_21695 [Micromonospora sp. NPDC050686]|uniref:hypothetical protein n=1 Tax=Micromonospora sp. NPDC050686 TaxID=3154631 RepID=UPI0033F7B2F0